MKLVRAIAMIVVVDFMAALVLMQAGILQLANITPKVTPSVDSIGSYILRVDWQTSRDVDTYVQEPSGHITYFDSLRGDSASLEYDDIGDPNQTVSTYLGKGHEERVDFRGIKVGEYIVNVHEYRGSSLPLPVHIRLYNLLGSDRIVYEKTVVLLHQGEQVTAFRFTVNSNGDLTDFNTIQKKLVPQSW